MNDLTEKIAEEFRLKKPQVEATLALLREEATVPFIAHYRKDRTGGLDDGRIRAIRERWRYLEELEQRRALAIRTITATAQMTPELQTRLENCCSRVELEDIFLAYRSRRRVRSSIAKQKGLEGLAILIWQQVKPEALAAAQQVAQVAQEPGQSPIPNLQSPMAQEPGQSPIPNLQSPMAQEPGPSPIPHPPSPMAQAPDAASSAPVENQKAKSENPPVGAKAEDIVKPFINPEKGVKDMAEALAGARDIVAERIAEDAACRKLARELFHRQGKFVIKAREGVDLSKGKYAAFAQVAEPFAKVTAHRYLLAQRGVSEKQLVMVLETPREKILAALKNRVMPSAGALLSPELALGVEEAFDRLLAPGLDHELRQELKRRADEEVIAVCARNFRSMLLQPPLGRKAVLALEPVPGQGLRCAVLDPAGKLLAHALLTPEKGPEERQAAAAALVQHLKDHKVKAVAIGDGAGSREADLFVREVLGADEFKDVLAVVVHLHGLAQPAREETDVELAARGAAALGRYLQDPLADLAKQAPANLSLGQHQHDVDQGLLKQKLEEVLETCVNEVGADVNTAPAAVLRHVAGIGDKLAEALVATRDTKRGFKTREELREIPGAGPKTFEQCAGFLRILDGENPLDATAHAPGILSRRRGDGGCNRRRGQGPGRQRGTGWQN